MNKETTSALLFVGAARCRLQYKNKTSTSMHNNNFLISHRLQTRIDMRHIQTAIHNDSLLYPVKWPLVNDTANLQSHQTAELLHRYLSICPKLLSMFRRHQLTNLPQHSQLRLRQSRQQASPAIGNNFLVL